MLKIPPSLKSNSANTFANVGEMDKVLESQHGFCNFINTEVTPCYQDSCSFPAVLWNLSKSCQTHVQSCFKFIPRQVLRSLRGSSGICSAPTIAQMESTTRLTPSQAHSKISAAARQTAQNEPAPGWRPFQEALIPRIRGFRHCHATEGHLPCLPLDGGRTTLSP